MRKIALSKLLVIFFLLISLPFNVKAAEETSELIDKLEYDVKERRLTGQTAPNANISFSEFVADIVADEKGKFQVVIPGDIKKSHIRIDDFIDNRYAEVEFDFVAGTIATSSDVSLATTSNLETPTRASSTKLPTKETDTPQESKPTGSKKNSTLLWVLLLVIIVSGTVTGLLYSQKIKEKKRAEKKRKSSKRKKHRRKRNSSRK